MTSLLNKRKEMVQKIFKRGVERLNRYINIREFQEKYSPNQNRTLELNIYGMEDIDTGFVIEDGKIRTYKRLEDEATCKLWMSEDTFISIRTRKISMTEAYYYGYITATGKNFLRDLEIFQKIIDENEEAFFG